jgi:tetratricopeptide (TPR) repeat protein
VGTSAVAQEPAPSDPKLKTRQDKPPAGQPQEQEPPEEEETLKPKECVFNPLQAEKEMKTGNYYFHKGSFKAAAGRFREATCWSPSMADAFFRLGEAEEKLRHPKAAREAFMKYLELAPDGKEAATAKKKLTAH